MKHCFPENLRNLRVEKKISQTALAQHVGVSQQCVSEWEQGNIEPTLSNLWALADLFEVSIDLLVGRIEY
jgi:transcriptional regulator with XRE-family HTH domain